VELKYTELLVPTDGYTSLSTRRSSAPATQTNRLPKLRLPTLGRNPIDGGEKPPYGFDIQVHLAAGLPLQEVICPSHRVHTRYEDRSRPLSPSILRKKNGGNRDFILRYRLAGGQIQSGLLLYEERRKTFSPHGSTTEPDSRGSNPASRVHFHH